MYRILWTNFGYFAQQQFDSLEDAVEYGKSKCFEFQVYYNRDLIGWWTVFGGLTVLGKVG